MTSPSKTGVPILRRGAAGFLVILVALWLAEIFHVPYHLFGEAREFNWMRILFRTAIVLAVWAWVHFSTRRLVQRLHRLEKFLLVCSWCRRVGDKGTWMTLEEYFGQKFDTQTSHGICPACMDSQRAKHYMATRVNAPEESVQPTAQ